MIQENDNSPPHSSSSSNSDLNSIVSYENDWKVKNLSRPTSMSSQNLRTLEKPVPRMKIAPPAPPKQLRNPKMFKSQPVWANSDQFDRSSVCNVIIWGRKKCASSRCTWKVGSCDYSLSQVNFIQFINLSIALWLPRPARRRNCIAVIAIVRMRKK